MKQLVRCLACVCALLGGLTGRSPAQSIVSEVRLGVLDHDIGFLASHKEDGVDLNGEVLFVSPVPYNVVSSIDPRIRWLLTPRPDLGIDVNTAGNTSQLYFGLVWTAVLFKQVFLPNDHIFTSIGFGPAFNNGEHASSDSNHKSLGSNVLFHPSLEIGYWFNPHYSLSVYYEHSSNGGLADRNEGLNNAGIRFGLAF